MKCLNCRKNFDYEKYYGICPKCGCFNKKETAQEQHQRYHEAFDGGVPSCVYPQKEKVKEKSGRGSTIFLIVSIVVFVMIYFGGTVFGMLYQKGQENNLQREAVEVPAEQQEHAMGESFSFQGMTLTVTEARVLAEGWQGDPSLPQWKKLVGVKLKGESNGEWADKNQLSDAYICYGGYCYWQIPVYEYEEYADRYEAEPFGRYTLCI